MRAALLSTAWYTALGHDASGAFDSLYRGQRAVTSNRLFDASRYACTVAATIREEPAPSRHRRYLRRMGLLAVQVAQQALAQSPVRGDDRLGLYFGYGGLRAHWADMMPAFRLQEDDARDGWQRGLNLLHPFWMLQHLSNNAHALTAEELHATGEGATFGGANAGAQALSAALRALNAHAIDHALVVAHDSLVEPETLVEMAARGVLTSADANHVAAPYDQAAAGAVPGEAVVALLLGRTSAHPCHWLEAVDGADGQDNYPRAASLNALLDSIAQGDEAVDGCGVALTDFDAGERCLIADRLGAETPFFCSLAATGQVGAAAPLLQAVVIDEALWRCALPPIAGLKQAAPGPLKLITESMRWQGQAAIGLSVGAPGLLGAVRVSRS